MVRQLLTEGVFKFLKCSFHKSHSVAYTPCVPYSIIAHYHNTIVGLLKNGCLLETEFQLATGHIDNVVAHEKVKVELKN
jgi:hypothetical protein